MQYPTRLHVQKGLRLRLSSTLGPIYSLEGLDSLATLAAQIGSAAGQPPKFVKEMSQPLATPLLYDVIVCGGTLGIFQACALQLAGHR